MLNMSATHETSVAMTASSRAESIHSNFRPTAYRLRIIVSAQPKIFRAKGDIIMVMWLTSDVNSSPG